MSAARFKLLFFGSDSFSVKLLSELLTKKLCPIQIVTKPGSVLDTYSSNQNLKRYQWPLDHKLIKRDEYNIGLVASFGDMIDTMTIKSFEYGLFNVHPSLLPQYRGSTPIQTAILNGLRETGCTIMQIPPLEKFDIGDIIMQERTVVHDGEYAVDLASRLSLLGALMSEKLLTNYDLCLLNSRPQNDLEKSYARKILPKQGLICFKIDRSDQIDCKIRAYTGFIDLFGYCLNGIKIKLETMRRPCEVEKYDFDSLYLNSLRSHDDTIEVSPGTIHFHKMRRILGIKCSDHKWIAFEHCTPECKPRMNAQEFYNGYLSKVVQADRKTDR